ncbi:MAG: 4Fe-4S dicluster domain-containing protein [Desulfobacterales bacterium]|nr:MAG: 4Fe-4S dicluster domain-containing protein [Desulfobacterales bacterium]
MMQKRSFFGWAKPQIFYELLPDNPLEPKKIFPSATIKLFHKKADARNVSGGIQIGDPVHTGQKLSLFANPHDYVIATATGTITAIAPYAGDFGQNYTAITVDIGASEALDDQFAKLIEKPALETALNFLSHAPGKPPLQLFSDPAKPIHTIIICGLDGDLGIDTNQYILKFKLEAVKRGIQILKDMTGVDNLIIATAGETLQGYGHLGARVKNIDPIYPAALPHMMMQSILGQVVPVGQRFEDLGVAFFKAEAVASLAAAFDTGQIPVTKTLTFVKKDGHKRLIETKIGTPIGEIIAAFGEQIKEEDRVILGGPMTGAAIYALDHPVQPDTDAIMVLDRDRAAYVSDYPCINCGECVRACPARMPVNMLVRFLEAGHYEEAADSYDLYSCIGCGLCSFVCVSKIPIFQYIRLAQYELDRVKTAEAMNV